MTRRRILVPAVAVRLAGIGALAWAVYGGTSPPPPALAPEARGVAADGPRSLAVAGDGSYVGYRVAEEFVSFGVHDGRSARPEGVGSRFALGSFSCRVCFVREEDNKARCLRGRRAFRVDYGS